MRFSGETSARHAQGLLVGALKQLLDRNGDRNGLRNLRPGVVADVNTTPFDTAEVGSTLYRTPAITTVKVWYAKTPPGFVFAAKVPQVITREKCCGIASQISGNS
jgi:hypothetical protein